MVIDRKILQNKKIFFSKTTLQKAKTFFFGSKKRTIISLIILVALGFLLWRSISQATQKPQYQTATVTKGTIIASVTESGNVTTTSQGSVGSPTTGIIEEIYVHNGDQVTQGENLFKVKSTATVQEIASTYATYQNALVQVDAAQQNQLSSQATLEKDRAAVIAAASAVTQMQNNVAASQPNPVTHSPYTQNDIDGINSALTSAQETFAADEKKYTQSTQSIAATQASVNSAWLAYEATQDSVVTAPIDGTVANISVQPGDQVTASSGSLSSSLSNNANTGSVVLSIGNFSAPYIKVTASEIDVPNIHSGEKATITLNAYTGKTFVGSVKQVDTVGTITSGVVTYSVYVGFIAPSSGIEPGMSATVSIETARHDDVLTVPSGAVQVLGGSPTVRVLENGQMTSVPVVTGISSDTDTEITSGLTQGQTVVTGIVQIGTTGSSASSPFSATRGFGGGGVFFRAGGGGGGGTRGG